MKEHLLQRTKGRLRLSQTAVRSMVCASERFDNKKCPLGVLSADNTKRSRSMTQHIVGPLVRYNKSGLRHALGDHHRPKDKTTRSHWPIIAMPRTKFLVVWVPPVAQHPLGSALRAHSITHLGCAQANTGLGGLAQDERAGGTTQLFDRPKNGEVQPRPSAD